MLQRDSDTMNQAQVDLGMTIELGNHSLDEPGPITRVERPGEIEQDRHRFIADRDRTITHAALSSGCGPRRTNAVASTSIDGSSPTAGAIGI